MDGLAVMQTISNSMTNKNIDKIRSFQIRKLREDKDIAIAFVVNHTANTAWYEKFSKFIQDVDYHSTYDHTTDFSSVITKLYEDIKSTVVVKRSSTDLDDPNQISVDFNGNCRSMQNSVSWVVEFQV